MILDTAIHEAKNWRRRHVGNILCVSRRFYELAVPHLFRAFTGPSYRSLERLRDILRAHPALAQYLRNLDMTGLNMTARFMFRSSSSSSKPYGLLSGHYLVPTTGWTNSLSPVRWTSTERSSKFVVCSKLVIWP